MFRQLLALALLGSFGSLIADDWSDFRIPKHSLSSLRAKLSAHLAHDGRTDDVSGRDWNDSGLDARLSGSYLFDSDRFAIEADMILESMASRYSTAERSVEEYTRYRYTSSNEYVRENGRGSVDLLYYPLTIPLGIEASLRGETTPFQSWSSSISESHDTNRVTTRFWESESNSHQHFAAAAVGPSWGKIRDVSGVYDVYVLEKRLKETGTISQDLKPSTKHALAALFYRENDYRYLHERDRKFFWKDVEALLLEDPAFQRNLDAYALYRLNETIAPVSFVRKRGIRFTLLVEGSHLNSLRSSSISEIQVTDSSSSQTTDTLRYATEHPIDHNEVIAIGPRVDVHLPIGWTWHVIGASKLQRRLQPAEDGFLWGNELSVQHALADKWNAEYFFQHTRFLDDLKDRSKQHGHNWSFYHSISLSYYIEDKLSVSAWFRHSQSYAKAYFPNIPDSDYARFYDSAYAGIGLNYSFWGGRGSDNRDYVPRAGDIWNYLSPSGMYYWGDY